MTTASRHARVGLALILLATFLWGAAYVWRTSFEVNGARTFTLWDDAMISMTYARNLREGRGLVWMPEGERVLGISNPGVAFTMAALHLLPLPPRLQALPFQLLNLAALVVALWLVWRIAARFAPDDAWVPLGAVALCALSGPWAVWSLQGADVGFVSLWLLAAVYGLGPSPPGGRWFAGLALGLMLRVDAARWCAALLAVAAWPPRRRLTRALVGGVALAGVLGAGLAACWLYYGDPLPNTFYLKATGSPRHLVLIAGLRDVAFALEALWPPLLLAAIGFWIARRERVAWACGLPVAIAWAYDFWVGGDWPEGRISRFLAPALPLVMILASVGARTVISRGLVRAGVPRLGAVVFAALLLLVGASANPRRDRSDWLDPRSRTMYRNENEALAKLADYLARNTDPDTTVGVHWAGIVPYLSRRPAVDVLGKSDRHIARLVVPRFESGHSKWDWEYVMRVKRPDVLLRYSRGLYERRDFLNSYERVEVEGALYFYLRKEAREQLHDPDARFVALPARADLEAAALKAKNAVEIAPSAVRWLRLGDAYRRLGQSAGAREAYRRAERMAQEAGDAALLAEIRARR